MNPSLSKINLPSAQASWNTRLAAKARFRLRLLQPQTSPETETAPKIRVCLASLAPNGADEQLAAALSNEAALSVAVLAQNSRLLYFGQLLKGLRRYDIVHVLTSASHSPLKQFWSAVPALLIGKLYGKHTILHFYGESPTWRTTELTLRWADEVVTPSEELREVLAEHGFQARTISDGAEWLKLYLELMGKPTAAQLWRHSWDAGDGY